MRHLTYLALVLGLILSMPSVFAGNMATASNRATALLRCHVSYADQTQIIDVFPHSEPYETQAVDIGGRFTFKAVMIGEATNIKHIALYAFFQSSPKDLPIHEAVYRGPFKLNTVPTLLTPYNHLYAGEVERELKYHCNLSKVKK
jgi:hypothetical protein